MDDLSMALSRAISNLLQQTEKCFSDLQTKVDNLEIKCRELNEENTKIRESLSEKNTEIKKELSEENAKVRKELSEENAKIRKELSEENAKIRKELSEENAKIKKELSEENAKIEQKLNEEGAKIEHRFTEEKDRITLDLKTCQVEQDKQIAGLKSTLDNQHKQLDVCMDWAKFNAVISNQVHELNGAREKMDVRLKEFEESLTQLVDKTERYPQLPLTRRSPLVKSPSSSSYLNGNSNYNFLSKSRTQTFRGKNFVETFDVDEEFSEISDQAEHLLREVGAVSELSRSFEKNSMYSDD